MSRQSYAAKPRERWMHAVHKFARAISIKMAIKDRKGRSNVVSFKS